MRNPLDTVSEKLYVKSQLTELVNQFKSKHGQYPSYNELVEIANSLQETISYGLSLLCFGNYLTEDVSAEFALPRIKETDQDKTVNQSDISSLGNAVYENVHAFLYLREEPAVMDAPVADPAARLKTALKDAGIQGGKLKATRNTSGGYDITDAGSGNRYTVDSSFKVSQVPNSSANPAASPSPNPAPAASPTSVTNASSVASTTQNTPTTARVATPRTRDVATSAGFNILQGALNSGAQGANESDFDYAVRRANQASGYAGLADDALKGAEIVQSGVSKFNNWRAPTSAASSTASSTANTLSKTSTAVGRVANPLAFGVGAASEGIDAVRQAREGNIGGAIYHGVGAATNAGLAVTTAMPAAPWAAGASSLLAPVAAVQGGIASAPLVSDITNTLTGSNLKAGTGIESVDRVLYGGPQTADQKLASSQQKATDALRRDLLKRFGDNPTDEQKKQVEDLMASDAGKKALEKRTRDTFHQDQQNETAPDRIRAQQDSAHASMIAASRMGLVKPNKNTLDRQAEIDKTTQIGAETDAKSSWNPMNWIGNIQYGMRPEDSFLKGSAPNDASIKANLERWKKEHPDMDFQKIGSDDVKGQILSGEYYRRIDSKKPATENPVTESYVNAAVAFLNKKYPKKQLNEVIRPTGVDTPRSAHPLDGTRAPDGTVLRVGETPRNTGTASGADAPDVIELWKTADAAAKTPAETAKPTEAPTSKPAEAPKADQTVVQQASTQAADFANDLRQRIRLGLGMAMPEYSKINPNEITTVKTDPSLASTQTTATGVESGGTARRRTTETTTPNKTPEPGEAPEGIRAPEAPKTPEPGEAPEGIRAPEATPETKNQKTPVYEPTVTDIVAQKARSATMSVGDAAKAAVDNLVNMVKNPIKTAMLAATLSMGAAPAPNAEFSPVSPQTKVVSVENAPKATETPAAKATETAPEKATETAPEKATETPAAKATETPGAKTSDTKTPEQTAKDIGNEQSAKKAAEDQDAAKKAAEDQAAKKAAEEQAAKKAAEEQARKEQDAKKAADQQKQQDQQKQKDQQKQEDQQKQKDQQKQQDQQKEQESNNKGKGGKGGGGKTPRVPPRVPSGGGGEDVASGSFGDVTKAPGFGAPEQERFGAIKASASRGSKGYEENITVVENLRHKILQSLNEAKLSASESAKRKAEKQKYKVVYMQDGKKVEVFAATIRGVRRAAYGKSQFRVYDNKGSDLTAYFKKLMNEKK